MKSNYVPIAVPKLEDPTGMIWVERKEGESDEDVFNRVRPLPTNINNFNADMKRKIEKSKVEKKKRKKRKISDQRLALENAFKNKVDPPVKTNESKIETSTPPVETFDRDKTIYADMNKEMSRDEAIENKILKHLATIEPRTACLNDIERRIKHSHRETINSVAHLIKEKKITEPSRWLFRIVK